MKTLALLGVAAIAIACDSPTSPRAPVKAPTTMSAAVLDNDDFETVTGPRGQAIAFASDRDGFFQVFVMRPNGDQQTQLTQVPFYNARPNWSPDGRRTTFTACRWYDFSCDIYVMNADGSSQTNPVSYTHLRAHETL